jgi:pyridoxal phosphate enzyme (YggS family)
MNSSTFVTTLAERIASVREQIESAASKVGRSPEEITLIAVSKTVDRQTVDDAYAAGLRHFGENRVQDAARKFERPLPVDATLSMIGQLQSNKAGAAVRLFQRVESVDRVSLIEALDRYAVKADRILPVLLQVNVAGEAQKAGCASEDVFTLAGEVSSRPSLRLEGLMTIAPMVDNPEEVRSVFRGLCALRDQLQIYFSTVELKTLSMGMTNDFPVAIEEGATEVRIGRAIFG